MTDRWLDILTATLALVGILQLCVFGWQGLQLRRTVGVMEDARNRQLRAYVCVAGAVMNFQSKENPEVQVEIKNFGVTPAYNLRHWIHTWIERYPLNVSLPTPSDDFQMAESILPPTGTHIMVLSRPLPIPAHALPMIGTPEGTIYVYGEIRYRDAFGAERYTRYRLIYGGEEGLRGGLLKPDTQGNEAN